jgi:lipopolysaccharide biosynthesis protein
MTGTNADYSAIKLIAYYLTQFHPIPENDLWWGKGFTEWTNATKATPKFPGHYQPHLPTELGFYDLRLRQTRREQIELAKAYGIGGFCYHYYWFSGKRLLEAPLDDMLADKDSKMPFLLSWANENWTRKWDASNHKILIGQKYRKQDDLGFIKSVEPFLRDERYIRMNGKPILMVYRPQHLPNAKESIEIWKTYCKKQGIGDLLVFCAFTHGNWDYKKFGCDGGVEFPPHNKVGLNLRPDVNHEESYTGDVYDMTDLGNLYLGQNYSKANGFRGLSPSWDNTARTNERGVIGLNGTPENYEYWLSEALRKTQADYPDEERLVFINAWNEWAEGCHLEPCRKYGRAFLEATLKAKSGERRFKGWTHIGVPPEAQLSASQSKAQKTPIGRLKRKVQQLLK